MSENSNSGPKANHIMWNELVATDTNVAGQFYAKLFGWKPEIYKAEGVPAGAPPYTVFKLDDAPMGVGGMMQPMQPGIPSHWVPYIVVDDADASFANAVKLGAKVCLPVTAMGEIGRIAVLLDPVGATFGLHEMPKR